MPRGYRYGERRRSFVRCFQLSPSFTPGCQLRFVIVTCRIAPNTPFGPMATIAQVCAYQTKSPLAHWPIGRPNNFAPPWSQPPCYKSVRQALSARHAAGIQIRRFYPHAFSGPSSFMVASAGAGTAGYAPKVSQAAAVAPERAKAHIEKNVAEKYEDDYPWVRPAWSKRPLNVQIQSGKAPGWHVFYTGGAGRFRGPARPASPPTQKWR